MNNGNVRFYYNNKLYEGKHQQTDVYSACLEVLDDQGVSYTDEDTFNLQYYSKPKVFVDLGETA